jgi:hypothetical protein
MSNEKNNLNPSWNNTNSVQHNTEPVLVRDGSHQIKMVDTYRHEHKLSKRLLEEHKDFDEQIENVVKFKCKITI